MSDSALNTSRYATKITQEYGNFYRVLLPRKNHIFFKKLRIVYSFGEGAMITITAVGTLRS